jgi:sodium pump decarboxylase gamma subunit
MELFREGIEVAVFGILMVYVLLGGLVVAVSGMSRVASWLAPETPAPPPTARAVSSGADAADLTAAVAAAIHAHRSRTGKGGR